MTVNLSWETEIDTPATVGIIGGGPAGIEAALYARFLGYDVQLFSSARIGGNLKRWGDHQLPIPFRQAATPLGLAALEAQETPCKLEPDAHVTFVEYVEQYLVPVAKTDLIHDSITIQASVRSISRLGVDVHREETLEQRAEREFRLLVDSRQRGQYSQIVDIVLDCGGRSAWAGMASGAGRAAGEIGCEGLLHGRRDVLDREKPLFAGKHTVLWGDTLEACSIVADFYRLADENPGTQLTWAIPKSVLKSGLASRLDGVPEGFQQTIEKAQAAIETREMPIVILPCYGIESCQAPTAETNAGTWALRLQSGADETLDVTCDQVINCGRREADWSMADAVSPQPAPITDSQVATSEPHYYVLGNKLLESNVSSFADVRDHIRSAFALIGGRAELDLYATVRPIG
ncbi:MAG: hypothetical protein Aurels2KO_19960 [Aureliella sp.]